MTPSDDHVAIAAIEPDVGAGVARGEEVQLGMRLHAFSNTISGNFYQRTEEPLGIALPEWRVLRAVVNDPGISQGEVATAQGLNVMTVSRAVAGLRTKGLLETRPNPDDRRRSQLTPTDDGRALAVDLGARAECMYGHVFSVLTAGELAMLDELMLRVNAHVSESELPDPPGASRDWAAVIEENKNRA